MTLTDHAVFYFSKVWAWCLYIVCEIFGLGKIYKDHPCMICGSNGPDHFPDCTYVELRDYVRG